MSHYKTARKLSDQLGLDITFKPTPGGQCFVDAEVLGIRKNYTFRVESPRRDTLEGAIEAFRDRLRRYGKEGIIARGREYHFDGRTWVRGRAHPTPKEFLCVKDICSELEDLFGHVGPARVKLVRSGTDGWRVDGPLVEMDVVGDDFRFKRLTVDPVRQDPNNAIRDFHGLIHSVDPAGSIYLNKEHPFHWNGKTWLPGRMPAHLVKDRPPTCFSPRKPQNAIFDGYRANETMIYTIPTCALDRDTFKSDLLLMASSNETGNVRIGCITYEGRLRLFHIDEPTAAALGIQRFNGHIHVEIVKEDNQA